jgi:hypothetical protein
MIVDPRDAASTLSRTEGHPCMGIATFNRDAAPPICPHFWRLHIDNLYAITARLKHRNDDFAESKRFLGLRFRRDSRSVYAVSHETFWCSREQPKPLSVYSGVWDGT